MMRGWAPGRAGSQATQYEVGVIEDTGVLSVWRSVLLINVLKWKSDKDNRRKVHNLRLNYKGKRKCVSEE